MKGRASSQETATPVRRISWAIGILALATLVVMSGFDRAGRPLPAGLSCTFTTARSCVTYLSRRAENEPAQALLSSSETLARNNPLFAEAQALHGSLLAKADRPELAGQFMLNSARLGWREKAGQVFSYLVALGEGNADRAALHLDSILTVDGQDVGNPSLIGPMLANPATRQAFAPHLATGQNYRDAFVASYRSAPDEEWETRLDLLNRAVAEGYQVPDGVAGSTVWQLYRRDPLKALDFWLAVAGDGDFADNAFAFDASLSATDLSSAENPFLWHSPRRGGGAPVEIAREDGDPAIVFSRRLRTPAREMAAIALPLPSGLYPLEWATVRPGDPVFLGARCLGEGSAELLQVQEVNERTSSAILEVSPNCRSPFLTIVAGQGENEEGSGMDSISLAGRAILQ